MLSNDLCYYENFIHAHAYIVTSRTTINLIVLERIVKLLELVSNAFVFVYAIKYVQYISNTASDEDYTLTAFPCRKNIGRLRPTLAMYILRQNKNMKPACLS